MYLFLYSSIALFSNYKYTFLKKTSVEIITYSNVYKLLFHCVHWSTPSTDTIKAFTYGQREEVCFREGACRQNYGLNPFGGCVSHYFALCVQAFEFHTVLLTISNYLPVRAKGNKFPPIQPAAIILWTPASTDSS